MEEELERLKVQLTLTEEAEKKSSTEDATTSEAQSVNNTPVINGHIEKLVNGEVSTHSDSTTAVNTPVGSSTPIPKVTELHTAIEPGTAAQADSDVVVSADVLRLQVEHLEKLLRFLNSDFAATRQKLLDLLANSEIKFNLLWCLFRLGSVITFKDYESGLTMAGEVPLPLLITP